MSKSFRPKAIARIVLSPVTFVSGKGADRGTCASPRSPCRTFQFAFDQTSPGGEIKALDSADYGRLIVNKSVSITGVEGAGIGTAAADAIVINAAGDDRINLSHLILDGFRTASNGIVLTSGGSLTVSHCTVRNFGAKGIFLQPTGQTSFLIAAATVSDNGGDGIFVGSQGSGSARGILDHVLARNNDSGIFVSGPASVLTVIDSMASDNTNVGFIVANRGAVLRLAHSVATGNRIGIVVEPAPGGGATAESAGNNFIRGNTELDVRGLLTNIGTK